MQASVLKPVILLLQATGGDYLGLTGPYMGYVVSSGTVTDAKSYSLYQTQVCYMFNNTVFLTSRFATDAACHLCRMYIWLGFDLPTCIWRADQEVTRIMKAFPVKRLDHLSLAFVCFACCVSISGICCFFAVTTSCSASAVRRLVVCR